MIGRDDEAAAALRRMLVQRANEAPETTGLAERVEQAANIQRKRRTWATVAAAGLASVAVLFAVAQTLSGSSTPAPTANSADGEWRWESYRGIELQVPAEWDHGTIGAWCAATGQETPRPPAPGRVGRPGIVPAMMCRPEHPPLAQRRPWVNLDVVGTHGVDATDGGWVAETREVSGAFITVFSPDQHVRERILESAQPVTGRDRQGCAPEHDVAVGRDFRPTPLASGLPAAGAIDRISVCRYARSDAPLTHPSILSASRLSGRDARTIAHALEAAPKGEGPNDSTDCSADAMFGEEVLLLRLRGGNDTTEIVVRYHGCDGHAIDDGETKRKLTADVLKPLLTGPHVPTGLSGPVAELLWQ